MRIAYPLRLSSCTGSKIYRVPWLYNRIISSLKMLRSRLFQSLRASKLGANTKAVVSRNFGAAGHDHAHSHHAPAGPYDVPHHPSQPNEAYLFGINPNEKYQSQGFEFITISTYLICFGILFFGAMTKDHNSFKVIIFTTFTRIVGVKITV